MIWSRKGDCSRFQSTTTNGLCSGTTRSTSWTTASLSTRVVLSSKSSPGVHSSSMQPSPPVHWLFFSLSAQSMDTNTTASNSRKWPDNIFYCHFPIQRGCALPERAAWPRALLPPRSLPTQQRQCYFVVCKKHFFRPIGTIAHFRETCLRPTTCIRMRRRSLTTRTDTSHIFQMTWEVEWRRLKGLLTPTTCSTKQRWVQTFRYTRYLFLF